MQTNHEAQKHHSRCDTAIEQGEDSTKTCQVSAKPLVERPKVGEMLDEPFHFPDSAFAPLTDQELKEWGI